MMKAFRKLMVVLLSAFVFAGTTGVSLLAEDFVPPTTGSITITDEEGNTFWPYDFTLYRIFDAQIAFDSEGNVVGISYTCTDAQKSIPGFGDWFEVSGNRVTAKAAAVDTEGNLSEDAVNWIKQNISDLGTVVNAGWPNNVPAGSPYRNYTYDENGKGYAIFGNLPFGWYYLEHEIGAAVVIDSTKPNASVLVKNERPSIEKTITDLTNADDEEHDQDIQTEVPQYYYQSSSHVATVQIGDTVGYKIDITAEKGAEDYFIADRMTTGLTLKPDTVQVLVEGEGGELVPLSSDAYTLYTSVAGLRITSQMNVDPVTHLTDHYTYTLTDVADGQVKGTFETRTADNYYWVNPAQIVVVFNQSYLNTIKDTTHIYVTYDAVVNENAIVAWANPNSITNNNEVLLHYGHGPYGPSSSDTVYTARIKIFKYEGDGDSSSSSGSKPLNGVKFVLKRADGKYLKQDPSDKIIYWVDNIEDAIELVTGRDGNGVISIEGLTNGTYTLVETEALPGYNVAPETTVVINNKTNNYYELNYQVNIANKTGSLLPDTGGTGVTIFYIIGGALVLGAVLLLVTRRRAERVR